MRYKDHGSTTHDADCDCLDGFHFENEDQRACVPNRYCEKGYGQSEYGRCVKCIDQHMYSDTRDRIHRCKPLTNCEKQSRCNVSKSNGTRDNVCGPKVADVKMCEEPQAALSEDTGDTRMYVIAGGVIGSVFLVILILLIIFIVRRNSIRRRKYAQRPLSQDQLEELKLKILKECERDSALCKKVLSKSVFVVEERIERQIWGLAQELYRSHSIQGKYELIVEKYKDSQHKYAVNGYLQEWKSWRGENKEAVAELFRCLRHCKRDDIVYEICNGLRQDVGYETEIEAQLGQEGSLKSKQNCLDELNEVFCPCIRGKEVKATPKGKVVTPAKEKEKDAEASGKLLDLSRDQDLSREQEVSSDPHDAGVIFRSRPSPSAPPNSDGCHGHDDDSMAEAAQLAMLRQYSQPVQATT
ncbi:uncharacterized protein [Littorina saxatilis]|uniref:uncharacterized protein n=1 Tax=Littorina saxatilis TaxID=31220 RepID=UPI0038B6AD15